MKEARKTLNEGEKAGQGRVPLKELKPKGGRTSMKVGKHKGGGQGGEQKIF